MRKNYHVSFTLTLEETNATDLEWVFQHVINLCDMLSDGEDVSEYSIVEREPPEFDYPSGESSCQHHDKG